MKVIRGKKALVTGAASGIGRSIALALAREGADLFLLDNNAEKLSRVIDEARAHCTEIIGRECDVGRPNEIEASVRALVEAWGRLDILVNNAGVIYHGDTEKRPTRNGTACSESTCTRRSFLSAGFCRYYSSSARPTFSTFAVFMDSSRSGRSPHIRRASTPSWV
jgi:NAD(P)-dependent dehydrogenase (short-subunit alcohol dehydrogenase family)